MSQSMVRKMKINVSKKDIIWNYLGVFMTMGSNLILLPFMVYFLDGDSLGLWYIFLSIGGIVTLFDFGFNPTIARNIAFSWSGAKQLDKTDVTFIKNHTPNIVLLKKVILTCKRIYLLISLAALLILLTLGTYYVLYLSKDMTGNNHIVAWIIYSFAVYLNLYYGYYASFLRGVGAISKINIANIFSRSMQILISVLLLYFGFGLIAVSFAYLCNGFLFRMLSKMYFYKFENIGQLIRNDNTLISADDIKQTFSLVWHNASKDGLVSLSAFLSSQASILICSLYLSLTDTAAYSISMQLVTAIASISGALYTAFQPSLQSAYINRDIDKSRNLMSSAMTVYQVIFWISIIILISIGLPILSLIKSDVEFNIYILLAIALYTFLLKHHSYYASFISNTNNVPYMKSFIMSSLGAIVLALLLIQTTNLGIWGLIIAQLLVQGVYNNWMWPHKVFLLLGIKYVDIYKIGLNEIKKKLSNKLLKNN